MSKPSSSTSSSCEGPSVSKRSRPSADVKSPCLPINLWRLHNLIDTDEKAIAFCQDHGLLPQYVKCPTCECCLYTYHKQERVGHKPFYRFVCSHRACRKASTPNQVSLKKGTWFEGSKISLQKSLVLVYCFVHNFSQNHTLEESSLTDLTSSETVVDFFNFCREVCLESLYHGSKVKQIGGPDCTVDIIKAKFERRKFNRGCLIEGGWVLGGICRETKDCFLVPIEDCTELSLVSIIKHFVKQGSKIHTECFASNDCLKDEGYQPLTVNHSENIGDPMTGACPNMIDSSWWCVRRKLPIKCARKKYFGMYLAEYIWRKTHCEGDVFVSFLRSIAEVYKGVQK